MRTRWNRKPRFAWAGAVFIVAAGCGGTRNSTVYFDPEDHPPEAQANFDVFARRCSKCHSLARPLVAGVTEVTHWDHYVARMVRQPGSGITPRDVEPILAFLYYYTIEVRGLAQPEDEETLAPPPEDGGYVEDRGSVEDGLDDAPTATPDLAPGTAPISVEAAPTGDVTTTEPVGDGAPAAPVEDDANTGSDAGNDGPFPAAAPDSQEPSPGVGPE